MVRRCAAHKRGARSDIASRVCLVASRSESLLHSLKSPRRSDRPSHDGSPWPLIQRCGAAQGDETQVARLSGILGARCCGGCDKLLALSASEPRSARGRGHAGRQSLLGEPTGSEFIQCGLDLGELPVAFGCDGHQAVKWSHLAAAWYPADCGSLSHARSAPSPDDCPSTTRIAANVRGIDGPIGRPDPSINTASISHR